MHATWYAFAVVALVIVIDVSRLTVSWRSSKRYRSAALASNAVHFASDLGGSFAVLAGLLLVRAGHPNGDSIAALFVAVLVLGAAAQLMRVNVDVLMDRVPAVAEAAARAAIASVRPAVELRRLRMRQAGGRQFADVVIGVPGVAPVGQGHAAADSVEAALEHALPGSDVVVHVEPLEDAGLRDRAHAAALGVPGVREIHNLALVEIDGHTELSLHVKLPGEMSLEEAHDVAEQVERAICAEVPEVDAVQTHLEPLTEPRAASEVAIDAESVERIVLAVAGRPPRSLRFLRTDEGLVAFLTLALDPQSRLRRGPRPRRRDRGTDPARAPRDRRRDRPHRAMKLCMFSPKDQNLERGWPGRVDGDRVVQLAAQTLEAFFTGGGTAREHAEYPLADIDFRPPVFRARSVRDFAAFTASPVPFFSFGNPGAIRGPEEEIAYPEGTSELDYGLSVAALIGADGVVGGYTVMNAWAARDLERVELASGLGPSKSRDFAISIGPVLVTADEFDGATAELVARVNGEERSRASLRDLRHSWEQILEHAGRNTFLRAGDLLGTGNAASIGDGRWLAPGDLVELEVEGIGVLRNTIVAG